MDKIITLLGKPIVYCVPKSRKKKTRQNKIVDRGVPLAFSEVYHGYEFGGDIYLKVGEFYHRYDSWELQDYEKYVKYCPIECNLSIIRDIFALMYEKISFLENSIEKIEDDLKRY